MILQLTYFLVANNTADNIGYSPAGITTLLMKSLYLKIHAQAQIIDSHPAGG